MFRPGVRFMLLSAFAFSAMTACVKWTSVRVPPVEIVLVRALISLLLSAFWLWRTQVPWTGRRRGLLLLRGLFGFLGLHCVFYAVAHLPLAEATVLQYLHPLFTALLAGVVLAETAGRGLWAGLACSLLGLALVTQPALTPWPLTSSPLTSSGSAVLDPFAAGVAIAGAFFSACAYVVVRKLAATEDPLVIVLYFPLVTVPATLPAVVANPVWPAGPDWLALIGVGVFAQIGQVALTHGMRHETAGRGTALSYLQVVFAAIWGMLLFREQPGLGTLLGSALIVAGSFLAGREPARGRYPGPMRPGR